MPIMNQIELKENIRRVHKDYRNAYVIGMLTQTLNGVDACDQLSMIHFFRDVKQILTALSEVSKEGVERFDKKANTN